MRGRAEVAITPLDPLDLDDGSEGTSWQQMEQSSEEELEREVRGLLRQTR